MPSISFPSICENKGAEHKICFCLFFHIANINKRSFSTNADDFCKFFDVMMGKYTLKSRHEAQLSSQIHNVKV